MRSPLFDCGCLAEKCSNKEQTCERAVRIFAAPHLVRCINTYKRHIIKCVVYLRITDIRADVLLFHSVTRRGPAAAAAVVDTDAVAMVSFTCFPVRTASAIGTRTRVPDA